MSPFQPKPVFGPEEQIVPDPKPAEDLRKLTENQPVEFWQTLTDPNYRPVTLDHDTVDMFNKTREEFDAEIATHVVNLPDNEFIPMMDRLLKAICGFDLTMFLVPAYIGGAGLNITFSNIDAYRSVHANAVRDWHKQAFAKFSPELERGFFSNPLSAGMVSIVKAFWYIREMPLAIGDQALPTR